MPSTPPHVSNNDLNAFVDGRLTARAARTVASQIKQDAGAAARAASWRQQSEALHAAFAGTVEEPLPPAIALRAAALRSGVRTGGLWLAVFLAFAAGVLIGLAIESFFTRAI